MIYLYPSALRQIIIVQPPPLFLCVQYNFCGVDLASQVFSLKVCMLNCLYTAYRSNRNTNVMPEDLLILNLWFFVFVNKLLYSAHYVSQWEEVGTI